MVILDIIDAKLEENKIVFTKKFALKNEMVKNYKYLETEIKHFVDLYTKKFGDKSDNWLLAKKPVGNYTCASCENFIGDLNDKNQFVPWNKVPARDQSNRQKREKINDSISIEHEYLKTDNNVVDDEYKPKVYISSKISVKIYKKMNRAAEVDK